VLQFILSHATYDALLTKYAVFEKIERTPGHVAVGRARVKEFAREIMVCGLPSLKASRISRGLIKPRAAVVGGRRGQSDGNYQTRRDSRNGTQSHSSWSRPWGRPTQAIHHRSAVLAERLPIGRLGIYTRREQERRGSRSLSGSIRRGERADVCVRVFLSGSWPRTSIVLHARLAAASSKPSLAITSPFGTPNSTRSRHVSCSFTAVTGRKVGCGS